MPESAAPTGVDPDQVTALVMEQFAAHREQAGIDADQLAATVTNRVMESVATYMASDAFANLIATKIAAQKPARRRAAKD